MKHRDKFEEDHPAMWIWPDGVIKLPVQGVKRRAKRVYDDAAPEWRARLKNARDALGWTDEGIAIFTGYSRQGVRTWMRSDTCPPRIVVKMMEALCEDHRTAQRVFVHMEKEYGFQQAMARARTKVVKKKLVPGWLQEQEEARTRGVKPIDLADLVAGGKSDKEKGAG